jgi:hypothetical protein
MSPFVPKIINPKKLQEGFEWLNPSFLSWGSIFRRFFRIHQYLTGKLGTTREMFLKKGLALNSRKQGARNLLMWGR